MKHTLCAAMLLLASAAFGADQLDANSKSFLENAWKSNQLEIQLGQLASQKSTNDQIKIFSATLVKEHTSLNAELKKIADKYNYQLPETAAKKDPMYDKLSGLSGNQFDMLFVQVITDEHNKAIKLFEDHSKLGTNADLKLFASTHVPHLREHLAAVKDLQNNLAVGTPAGEKGLEVGVDRDKELKVDTAPSSY